MLRVDDENVFAWHDPTDCPTIPELQSLEYSKVLTPTALVFSTPNYFAPAPWNLDDIALRMYSVAKAKEDVSMTTRWNRTKTFRALALMGMLATSHLLNGCQTDRNPIAGASLGGEPELSRTQLTDEEFASLESRQRRFIAAGSAFVEAAAKWEANALTAGNQGTSDRSEDPMPKETVDGLTLDWMTMLRTIQGSTIGYAWEGRSGEFLFSPFGGTGAVRVIRNGEELELLKPDANGIPRFIGVVRKTGEYIPITRFRKGMPKLENAPKFWTDPDMDSGLKALQSDSPILCGKRSGPKRLSGALGWLFPTSDGILVCASENVDPIENVLWIVQNGEGLDILHSGPEYSGYYARVSPDCAIKFQVPFRDSPNTDWSSASWRVLDHNGHPTFNMSALSGQVLPARLEDPNIIYWINSDETLSLEVPPLVD